ncbi:hypothetical protein MRBLWO14_000567 [Microbacterium sp. LWO14-1.2]|uniref:DUF6541 family protein n=1 Tax=Microbacterium sp. LWO14-1.2 TaxID=3135263 RepID=UPI003138F590
MILDWVAQSGLFALAVVVLFAPGLLLGALARLRGLALWALAPAISVGALALIAVVLPLLSVRWNHLSAALGILVLAAPTWLLGRLARPAGPPQRRLRSRPTARLLIAAGLIVGGGLNAARLMTYIGLPGAISQTNDAVFHLNALRWIAETGSASSLDVSGLIGASSFYPAAWHAVASLVAVDVEVIPVAVNMVALVIAAVVWPLGIAFLTRVVVRDSARIVALAAALSAGLLAFPQLMFEWGVLYPYALSLAVLPAVVAATVTVCRTWIGENGRRRLAASAAPVAIVVLGLSAVALSQPSSILVWGLLVMLWGTGATALGVAGRPRPSIIVLLIAGWLALALLWAALAYLAGAVLWRSYRGVPGAALDVLLNSHSLLPAAPLLSALMVVGLVIAVRDRRLMWLVASWVIVSMLYVVAVGTDLPVIKRALTGPWYGDSFRLASVVPIVVIPLAVIGVDGLIRWLAARRWRLTSGRGCGLTAVAVAVTAVLGTISVAIEPVVLLRVGAETDKQSRYAIDGSSYLSRDEYGLLVKLPDLLPEDAVLIANPSTGAAFAYVLGDRDIIPRTWSPPQSQAWDVIALGLRDAGEEAEVCDALAAYGAPEYVLDFGIGGTRPGEYIMPGMTDFDGRPGFEEVAREGDASLWRITACA